ncbi:ABC transporter permease [Novosphingobium sp. Chol11]|uniref:ABC transporter permease n=1 Tax=Novosphingobium sp. Chol11 TaxID=1385763 RepID=UPI0025ED65DE|nr:ABC transporter permease [Novosphingobium sp. Chol11]
MIANLLGPRLTAIIVKELWAILRDPRARISLVLPPLIQLLVFAYASTLEVTNVTIGVLDRDGGQWSHEIIQRVAGSPNVKRIVRLDSDAALERAINTQTVIAALRFDSQFSADVSAGRGAVMGAVFDGRKSNAAQIVGGYIDRIVAGVSADIHIARPPPPQGGTNVSYWFNPNLDYLWFTIPSLVVIISLVSSTSVVSQSVAREKELGTYDQLMVSPFRVWEILAGKMVPPVLIGLANASLYVVLNPVLFAVPFRGSLLLFYLSLIVFLIAMSGIGLLVSVVANTQQQAFLGMFALTVPVFLLSGYAAPVDNIPPFLQIVSEANPAKHFLIVTEGLFLKGMPAADVWANTWPMLVIAAVTISLASYLFRSRLE